MPSELQRFQVSLCQDLSSDMLEECLLHSSGQSDDAILTEVQPIGVSLSATNWPTKCAVTRSSSLTWHAVLPCSPWAGHPVPFQVKGSLLVLSFRCGNALYLCALHMMATRSLIPSNRRGFFTYMRSSTASAHVYADHWLWRSRFVARPPPPRGLFLGTSNFWCRHWNHGMV